LAGGKILGFWGQNDPKTSNERKTLAAWERTSLRQTASFEPLCEIISTRLACEGVQEKKA